MKITRQNPAHNFSFVLVILLFAFTGCKKEEIKAPPALDTEAYFNVRLDGVDYTAYGYIDPSSTITFGGPTLTKTDVLDISGRPFTKIALLANNWYVRPTSKPTKSDSLQLGNCTLKATMEKEGSDLLGVYNSFTGFLSDQKITNNANDEYYLGGGASNLFIDREVTHPVNKAKMIEGHCILWIYTSAGGTYKQFYGTGNFRMYLTH